MDALFYSGGTAYHASLHVSVQRTYDSNQAPYLISISTGLPHTAGSGCDPMPQARAVVDDFGNLRITRGWL